MSNRCETIERATGAKCDRWRGHNGPHGTGERSWPTRRERTGEMPDSDHDPTLDLACVERAECGGEERWWIMPSPARIAAGAEKVPCVMYAFRSRDTAEAVCITLNAMVLGDAIGAVAADEAVAA